MKEDLEGEVWKDVVGYEGLYKVSNMGRVYSMPKEWVSGKNNIIKSHEGKILKQNIINRYYYVVGLCINNTLKTHKVHQLVSESFLGHKRCGYKVVVDHIDNNSFNNNVSNLQLTTVRENSSKDIKNKTSKYRGVNWHKPRNKWYSYIYIKGCKKYLGSFECELKAHLAYQNALKELAV